MDSQTERRYKVALLGGSYSDFVHATSLKNAAIKWADAFWHGDCTTMIVVMATNTDGVGWYTLTPNKGYTITAGGIN